MHCPCENHKPRNLRHHLRMQGRYLVKFKIDDSHWRLAPDWPTSESPDGNENNILVVA